MTTEDRARLQQEAKDYLAACESPNSFLGTVSVPPDFLQRVLSALSAPAPSHEWLRDDIANCYRCNGCLVRSDKPHGPACPRSAPAAAEEKQL